MPSWANQSRELLYTDDAEGFEMSKNDNAVGTNSAIYRISSCVKFYIFTPHMCYKISEGIFVNKISD